MNVRVLIPEDLSNRLPGFYALVIWEETPYLLPVGYPTDGPPYLTWKHCVMVASGYRLILLLPATGGPDLPGGPFRLGVTHQACVETPLPEVHLPGYPVTDFL